MADDVDELLQLHRGQGLDLFWRDSLQCPTEEEYVEMVLGSESAFMSLAVGRQLIMTETGGLFRIAVKLMMARSDNDV
jgi:geranylgeranyl diphosphate synthase type 3